MIHNIVFIVNMCSPSKRYVSIGKTKYEAPKPTKRADQIDPVDSEIIRQACQNRYPVSGANIIAYIGRPFHDSHKNWPFNWNHATVWPNINIVNPTKNWL